MILWKDPVLDREIKTRMLNREIKTKNTE